MEILDKKKPLYHDLQEFPHEPTLKGDSRDRGEWVQAALAEPATGRIAM
jgi:hypothetical protein